MRPLFPVLGLIPASAALWPLTHSRPCSKTERLEFMYKGHGPDAPVLAALAQQPPSAAQATVPAPPPAAPAPPAEDGAARALSVYVDDTPKARNEAWARLHGDPMLMVRPALPLPRWRSSPAAALRRSSSRIRRR